MEIVSDAAKTLTLTLIVSHSDRRLMLQSSPLLGPFRYIFLYSHMGENANCCYEHVRSQSTRAFDFDIAHMIACLVSSRILNDHAGIPLVGRAGTDAISLYIDDSEGIVSQYLRVL